MTMTDNLCEVCRTRPPIGVACTSMPYSCAYCVECAQQSADPEIVFITYYDMYGTSFVAADTMTTWKDGNYITYRQWAKEYENGKGS